jgi:hypothetical protein
VESVVGFVEVVLSEILLTEPVTFEIPAKVGTVAPAAVRKYVCTSEGSFVNHVGVPVANSEEISDAAAARFVRATAWSEVGRASKRAKLADALEKCM